MINKIEINIENMFEKLQGFYKYDEQHFIGLNGVDLGENTLELQYIFSAYAKNDEITIYYMIINYDTTVPSVVEMFPSAFMSEREVVDMFGLNIENSKSGLYLDDDSLKTPLKIHA